LAGGVAALLAAQRLVEALVGHPDGSAWGVRHFSSDDHLGVALVAAVTEDEGMAVVLHDEATPLQIHLQ